MGAGCSAEQASSWRVLNPWESPAGSNKHKQPKKPELTKLYLLYHCLGESHSCHSTSFSILSCWREVVWGTPKAGGPVPISSEGSFWRLTANLRLFEDEEKLLALAEIALMLLQVSMCLSLGWLLLYTASLSSFSGWVFLPSSKAVSHPRPSAG